MVKASRFGVCSFGLLAQGRHLGLGLRLPLGDADPVDYSLPPGYREAIQKFMGYARKRGLCTASIKEAVAAIPKHDRYHFREDSTHRSMLANVIAHRIRVRGGSYVLQGPAQPHGRAGAEVSS